MTRAGVPEIGDIGSRKLLPFAGPDLLRREQVLLLGNLLLNERGVTFWWCKKL